MNGYKTELLDLSPLSLERASALIRAGEVVAIPTETVYGLAANALNSEAVKKIFAAKERPADNPLIVHIDRIDALSELAHDIPQAAWDIAETLFPAPLTIILPKKDCIPQVTSGGLDTVGIRMPDNAAAREIITRSGCFLAAPSANRSGYPSPTSAEHVMNDMRGRIPAVVDGGSCRVGVESTVICFEGADIRILRPGFITAEALRSFAAHIIIDETAMKPLADGKEAKSPGMKYKHYSPRADVYVVEGGDEAFVRFMSDKSDKAYALIFDRDEKKYPYRHLCYGDTPAENAEQLFSRLRELDELGADEVYVRAPDSIGIGLAVCNRLLRAAGFRIISAG